MSAYNATVTINKYNIISNKDLLVTFHTGTELVAKIKKLKALGFDFEWRHTDADLGIITSWQSESNPQYSQNVLPHVPPRVTFKSLVNDMYYHEVTAPAVRAAKAQPISDTTQS